MAIPNEFMCPITMVIMKEPVLASDGYTYEKEAIQQWLQSNTISPLTRESMRFTDCRPNRALKDAIERWQKEKQPTGKAKEAPKTKTRHPRASSPSFGAKEAPTVIPQPSAPPSFGGVITTSYQAASTDTDHMYAIMIQTQEAVEQIKRSAPPAVVQPSQPQVQRQLTEEQKKKYAMAVCLLFGAVIILVFVVDRIQSNASST